ncbi:MAG: OmpH family outer membrane protein [Eubacteriales bacterium]|nr:OmpH family outer membrane protein [Eubacteriales bacterium]
MKKILLTTALTCFLATNSAFAVDGYVNYQKILVNYSQAQSALKELDNKSFEIKQYIIQQEQQYKNTEADAKRKVLQEKALKELKTKEQAYLKLKQDKEQELSKNVKAAIHQVRLDKKLDIIIDANQVYDGGVDCTDDVIKILNSTK